jgi:hypothetical protein
LRGRRYADGDEENDALPQMVRAAPGEQPEDEATPAREEAVVFFFYRRTSAVPDKRLSDETTS